VEYYSARSTFRAIDGYQRPDVVTDAVEQAIAEVTSRKAAL
jgi:hypothetical protein